MSVLSPKAESLLNTLAIQPGVTQQHMAGLRDAITSSPALVELFNDTLANSSGSEPELTALGLLSPGDSYGAKYDPSSGTLKLNLQSMLSATIHSQNSGNLTFLFAHELEHARNAVAMKEHWGTFYQDVRSIAATAAGPPRDYSAPAEAYLAHTRHDEARAQVRGLNILADRLQAEGKPVNEVELHALGGVRTEDFFDIDRSTWSVSWKKEYAPNLENTLTLDASNQAAIDTHYYYKAPEIAQMGPSKHSDNSNHYGSAILQVVVDVERDINGAFAHDNTLPVALNLSGNHLRSELLHCNGVNLHGEGRVLAIQDTGNPALPFYALPHHVPTSHVPHGPAAPGRVVLPPPMAPMATPPALAPASAGPATSQLGQPATLAELPMAAAAPDRDTHSDPLLAQIQGKVAQLDAAQGKPWDQHSANLSASLYASAREHGFERLDHVLLSHATATKPAGAHVFLVQGSPDDPAHQRAHLATAEAVAAPESQSLQRAQALETTQQAEQQMQAQEHSQQVAMQRH